MKTVVVLVVIALIFVDLVLFVHCLDTTEKCEVGWFGDQFMYKCRCDNDLCDANGTCIGSSRCQKGWFGPACQYDNIILKAKNSSFSGRQERSCNLSISDIIFVSWKKGIPFTWLRITVNETSTTDNLLVNLKLQYNSNKVNCVNTSSIVDNKTLDIHCDVAVLVTRVVLRGKDVIRICSLYISGGRNVAIKQLSNQSSTYKEVYSNYDFRNGVLASPKAVDGNTSGNLFKDFSCTHTEKEESPSWQLEFTSTKLVNKYVLYNIDDNNADRLIGFVLQSYSANKSLEFMYTDKTKKSERTYDITDENVNQHVRSINISLPYNKEKQYLTLCEVEVYGDSICPQGSYGRDCEKTCNCNVSSEACFVSTGNCPSGCSAGYHGEGCQKACTNGKYGVNCLKQCNTSCVRSECNHVTGVCNECSPGKHGDQCEKDCIQGTFGNKCLSICSGNCKDGQSCNIVDGSCPNGCSIGFDDSMCDKRCDNGTFGQDCKSNCSQFCLVDASKEQSVCHHVSGECQRGCVSEYEGLQCLQLKISQSGSNSGAVAGPIIVVLLLIIIAVIGVLVWRRRKQTKRSNSFGNGSLGNLTDANIVDLQTTNYGFNGPAIQAQETADKPHLYTNKSEIPPANNNGDNIYCNSVTVLDKTAIDVNDMNKFMQSHNKEFFAEQFKKIPSASNSSMSVALSAENKNKNRYKNISAYDHSRVKLLVDEEKGHGDYINASYMQGYKKNEVFIASQGPNKIMLDDFVRMLWEQGSDVVVMLTNPVEEGKSKCEKYWPEDNDMMPGEIKVTLMHSQKYSDCVIRLMQLSKGNQETRTLTQFHYTNWPDKCVPSNPWSLVDFERRVASHATVKPIVVHCSAGVGRTGTFIGLRNVISQAEQTGFMDFFETLSNLRKDRVSMIQTLDQYVFLHKAAQLALVCIGKTVTTSDIFERVKSLEVITNRQSNLEKEFKALCNVCINDSEGNGEDGSGGSLHDVYKNSRTSANKLKNRFSNVLPKESFRPTLFCETKDLGEYINAVLLPSVTCTNGNILTQIPLPTTVIDFWRMITQYKVLLIVAFEMDTSDSTIGTYLPTESDPTIHCGSFAIETKSTKQSALWEEKILSVIKQQRRKSALTLSSSVRTEEYQVIHLKFTKCTFQPEELLSMVNKVRLQTPTDKSKILYMCRNGATYSGLLCVLSMLLERFDIDCQINVPVIVGSIKNIRPQVIPTVDQYRALYQVLKLHNDSSKTYSNCGEQKSKTVTFKGADNHAFDTDERKNEQVYANS